ncbi:MULTISPECIES: hypothetical protein [unclassified Bradyrhizobium]|uniref:hypothetical protein n=1 Tax=unclassified Bradyrhizobium TaxID=2631580 RepID=UPI001FFAEDA8|nr:MULTISPECIES: hypothetical protein [unclassified Bradyrhizobium]MCK1466630.1 hypothetical protein [Bradyrhizobium sp. CW10]MCK1499189.1 hypothetical protein [Bradyrhizobium sp. 188]
MIQTAINYRDGAAPASSLSALRAQSGAVSDAYADQHSVISLPMFAGITRPQLKVVQAVLDFPA